MIEDFQTSLLLCIKEMKFANQLYFREGDVCCELQRRLINHWQSESSTRVFSEFPLHYGPLNLYKVRIDIAVLERKSLGPAVIEKSNWEGYYKLLAGLEMKFEPDHAKARESNDKSPVYPPWRYGGYESTIPNILKDWNRIEQNCREV